MTLQRAILETLNNVAPMLMPEKALWADVNALLPAGATLTEVQQKLPTLAALGLVAGVTNRLEGTRKWRITDSGQAELANK